MLVAGPFWNEFWKNSYIFSTTVNSIDNVTIDGVPFLAILYAGIGVVAVFTIIFLRSFRLQYIVKPVVFSCIVLAAAFSLRMDYNWYRQWQRDAGEFSHADMYRKTGFFDAADAYWFANILKIMVPPEESVRLYIGTDYYESKFRYYLLPVKTSPKGNYIFVYVDKDVVYKAKDRTLLKNNVLIAQNVSMVREFRADVFLYKIGAS